MKILVTGGAGYIGSHAVKLLLHSGAEVVTLDNLSGGHQEAVLGGAFVEGDLEDRPLLSALFARHQFDAVMHFASSIQVGESVIAPAKYYGNNLRTTLNLLDAMLAAKVTRFVFSSSAAIFGNPTYTPIDEHHAKSPINPYGYTKAVVERILDDYASAYGFRSVSLRYFNAAGADPDGQIGETHEPETHLIPLVLRAAADPTREIQVFGDDYPTPDGTCIRDYIHVVDLCQAHVLAIEWLQRAKKNAAFNLGNGNGFSVREVINAAEKVTTRPIQVTVTARRVGDPAILVADSAAARRELGWKPRYDSLDTIVAHAWQWEQKRHGAVKTNADPRS